MAKKTSIPTHHPKTKSGFERLNRELNARRYVALDVLKSGRVRDISLATADVAAQGAQDMAGCMGGGSVSNGPLSKVAWNFDARDNTSTTITGSDGKPLGLGYVRWGAGDNIPSVIPPLAQSSPYTASPLRYLADLAAGLGPRLMYRFADGTMCEYKDAGERLKGEAKKAWERTWLGYDETDPTTGDTTHIPGAKQFLEENNLDLHIAQCMQDDVMLDIYFPTVGFQRGRRGAWNPRIVSVGLLPSHSTRLEKLNEYRHINHVYFSDKWRTKGIGGTTTVSTDTESQKTTMYPAAMPQTLLSDLRYIVASNQRTRIKDRPTWVVCPTYYPSLNKPYYPQPAWWSIFSSKAFDFASTILYDKYKARENSTSWGKVIYISLDYLEMVFADEGIAGDKEAQQKFIDELDQNVEQFLQQRDNNGKMMRQFMWIGQDGKEHHNVEIVDVAQASNDAAKAGKEELELSTSPIFLALGVDPRLVGVPMVAASNGGTALREMCLIKQQQLSTKQRLYLSFLNSVVKFNQWDEHALFVIRQQTYTTLDNSKTGTVETVAGEGA